MRVGPSAQALASAASWGCKVSSWLGATLLADDIPATGRVSAVAAQQVPEVLRLQVPRFSVENGRTVDWKPTEPDSPLARYGQQLVVTIIADGIETRIGRFQVSDWTEQGDVIVVEAAGLLQFAADDRLVKRLSPRDGGTLKSEFDRILPNYLSAVFDPGLTDRACPKGMEWEEDRLAALYSIADAWPARIRTDAWGQVLVLPPLPDSATPVVTLTDGERGTVISAPQSDTRQGAYNMVVARSSANGVNVSATASVRSGPMSVSGEYRPVPRFFSSPNLLTAAQCQRAADAMLADALRPAAIRRVSMAPDPRIELDDCVELIVDKGLPSQDRKWGFVVGYDLPLTVADGEGQLEVATF